MKSNLPAIGFGGTVAIGVLLIAGIGAVGTVGRGSNADGGPHGAGGQLEIRALADAERSVSWNTGWSESDLVAAGQNRLSMIQAPRDSNSGQSTGK